MKFISICWICLWSVSAVFSGELLIAWDGSGMEAVQSVKKVSGNIDVSDGERWDSQYGSVDGTYGGQVGGASQELNGCYLLRPLNKPKRTDTLRFSVFNQTDSAIRLDTVHVDYSRMFEGGAKELRLFYGSGDLAVEPGTLIAEETELPYEGTTLNYLDFDWPLETLANRTLAPGQTAVFELTVANASGNTMCRIDNLAVSGAILESEVGASVIQVPQKTPAAREPDLVVEQIQRENDPAWTAFTAIPKRYRPQGRWSWIDNRVTPEIVAGDVRQWESAGFGGFELQQLGAFTGMLAPYSNPSLEWLSPEWKACFKSAVETCRETGMLLTVHPTPGWSVGAPFVTREESGEVLGTARIKIKKAGQHVFTDAQMIHGPMEAQMLNARKNGLDPVMTLRRILLVNENDGWKTAEDITDQYAGGRLTVNVQDTGSHYLYLLWIAHGISMNHPPTEGGTGYKPDFFNKEPMMKLLDRVASELTAAAGVERFEDAVVAIARDSYESNQTWSHNFDEKFSAELGYSIEPYLPFIFPSVDPSLQRWKQKELPKVFADDELERVRYDYRWFVNKLLGETHYKAINEWAKAHGVDFLCQMYGWPSTFDQLENGLKVSAPDGDTWLASGGWNQDRCRYKTFNKFASSAAHINGIPRMDTEVTDGGMYQSTLTPYKQIANLGFLSGATAIRICNLALDDPALKWPGNALYSNFNRHTPWWPHARFWTENTARISAVLQNSTYCGRIGYFYPQNDMWRESFIRTKIHQWTWWHEDLWHAAQSAGYGADPVNDTVIQEGAVKDGTLCFGQSEFDVLLIAAHESMHPETVEGLIRFAENGGKVVFLDRAPERSLHLSDAEAGDRRVREGVERLKQLGAVVETVPRPDALRGKDLFASNWLAPKDAVGWMARLLKKQDAVPNIEIIPHNERICQIPYRDHVGNPLFFFANIDRFESYEAQVRLPDGNGVPYWWDPDTATRCRLETDEKGFAALTLRPLQSGFVVYEKGILADVPVANPFAAAQADVAKDVSNGWKLQLTPAIGEPSVVELNDLIDLGASDNPALRTFSGEAVYTTTFDWMGDVSKPVYLDLGTVYGTSEVTLNGVSLGTRWYGFKGREFDVVAALKKGRNELKVRILTSSYNLLKAQTDLERFPQLKLLRVPDWTFYPKSEQKKYHPGQGEPGKKDRETMPCGLVGPVVLKTI